MKIFLINSWYGEGSTGKLVKAFHLHLNSEGHEVRVFYGHGKECQDKGVKKINTGSELYLYALLCRITGKQGCYSTHTTDTVINAMKADRPDVVYLFNLHAYYLNEFKLLEYLKESGIPTVYMLFDEYAYMGKCCFSGECTKFQSECRKCPAVREYPKSLFFDRSNFMFKRKKSIYKDWERLTFAGVQFLADRAKSSAIAGECRFVPLDMGVDLDGIYYPRERAALRSQLGIPEDKKIVITVGVFQDKRKGIDKYYKIAELCTNDNIVFIHIGADKKRTSFPQNCIPVTYVSSQDELARYYSLADVYVMTTSGEAMSLTCMEALGCGCKLIGFDISGTPYSAGEGYGTFVPYNDLDAFADAIRKSDRKTEESIAQCRNYALSRYNITDYVKKLEKIGIQDESKGNCQNSQKTGV